MSHPDTPIFHHVLRDEYHNLIVEYMELLTITTTHQSAVSAFQINIQNRVSRLVTDIRRLSNIRASHHYPDLRSSSPPTVDAVEETEAVAEDVDTTTNIPMFSSTPPTPSATARYPPPTPIGQRINIPLWGGEDVSSLLGELADQVQNSESIYNTISSSVPPPPPRAVGGQRTRMRSLSTSRGPPLSTLRHTPRNTDRIGHRVPGRNPVRQQVRESVPIAPNTPRPIPRQVASVSFGYGHGYGAPTQTHTQTHPASMFDDVAVFPTPEQVDMATITASFSSIRSPINTTCPITLEAFVDTQIVTKLLHCGHIFNMTHLNGWFRTHTKCPVCRHDIRDYSPSPGSGPVLATSPRVVPGPAVPILSIDRSTEVDLSASTLESFVANIPTPITFSTPSPYMHDGDISTPAGHRVEFAPSPESAESAEPPEPPEPPESTESLLSSSSSSSSTPISDMFISRFTNRGMDILAETILLSSLQALNPLLVASTGQEDETDSGSEGDRSDIAGYTHDMYQG